MATTHTEQVISQTAGTVYVVRADVPDAEGLATFDCTCPAYNFRSSTVATVAYCKHTAALAKVLGLVPGLGSKTWQRPAVVSA